LIYKFVYNNYISNHKRKSNNMIIPVKCFTCGKVIGDKYRYYLAEVKKKKMSEDMKNDKVVYLTEEFSEKTPEGYVLDELKFNKMCCRRHFLSHVDIE
jgi:DNA-directed RNA polymerase subunit N (RpoN/RPB10)